MPTKAGSIQTNIAIASTCFLLGLVFAATRYDAPVLYFKNSTEEERQIQKDFYIYWLESPRAFFYFFATIAGLGIAGLLSKLYKPSEANTYFDGGALFLLMCGIIVFGTNILRGMYACKTGEWGEVDEKTGLSVIAASNFMIGLALVGVLVLEFGQFYAEHSTTKSIEDFNKKQAQQKQAAARAKEDSKKTK